MYPFIYDQKIHSTGDHNQRKKVLLEEIIAPWGEGFSHSFEIFQAKNLCLWENYLRSFFQLFKTFPSKWIGRRKIPFKSKTTSKDGLLIDLCLSVFHWAEFRVTEGAIVIHTILAPMVTCPAVHSLPREPCI
jgi:hypothetical protein